MIRHLCAAAVAGLVVVSGTLARAGTINAISASNITRSTATHPNNINPNWISREDCQAGDTFAFGLDVKYLPSETFQVWVGPAGADCNDNAARGIGGLAATCGLVYQSGSLGTEQPTITLSDRDILSALNHPGTTQVPVGTTADCNAGTSVNTGPQAVTIYFMLITGDEQTASADTGTIIEYALGGPAAPGGVSAGVGDTMLIVTWNQSADANVAGYYVFCNPSRGTEDTGGVSYAGLGDASASLCVPIPDAGGPDAEASAPDAAQASLPDAGAEADPTDGTVSGPGTLSFASSPGRTPAAIAPVTCPPGTRPAVTCSGSNALIPGYTPDPSFISLFQCGAATGMSATGATISGLQNGVTYNVSVAPFDVLGNVGPLSSVACGEPQHVVGFPQAYLTDGGASGGSSFCSVTRPGQKNGGTMASWLLLLVLGMARRRDRRR